MDYARARHYLLNKPEAYEDFPFGPDTAVYKVKGKMFASLSSRKMARRESATTNMNLKCDPNEAFMLRDIFDAVIPGYHMNKRLWNTIIFDHSIPPTEIERMIDNSYALVIAKLPKQMRMTLSWAGPG